jgi:hypothetical protein
MKIAKPFLNESPLDALIRKCFYESIEFNIIGDIKDFRKREYVKPLRKRRKRKKWRLVTVYVIKRLKNGDKDFKAKTVKIPVDAFRFRKYVKSGRLIIR